MMSHKEVNHLFDRLRYLETTLHAMGTRDYPAAMAVLEELIALAQTAKTNRAPVPGELPGMSAQPYQRNRRQPEPDPLRHDAPIDL